MRGYKACRGRARRRSSWNASKPPFSMRRRYLPHLSLKPGGSESLGSGHEPVRSPAKPMRLVGGTGSPEGPRRPPGYVLDRSDPEVLVLLCPQGEAVARFSARGAKAEAREREARKHHRERSRSA
jgi:hypothetical protein